MSTKPMTQTISRVSLIYESILKQKMITLSEEMDGWPAGWDWLLPGVMPIQVQAHEFNRHEPEALPAAFLPPPPPRPLQPPPLAAGLGAGGGSSPPGAALRPRPAGWRGWLRRRRRRRLRWKRRRRRRLAQVRYHLGPLTCA